MSAESTPNLLDPKLAFGRALKATRIERGVSQETLADESKMSRAQLSKVETGQGDLRLTSIFKLADGLGIQASDLLKRTEEVRKSNTRAEEQ